MNRDFIKFLGNKLKTGNLRSIHLNALPGRYATRLDITNLDIIDSEYRHGVDCSTSKLFLSEYLLKQSRFQFKISLESVSLTDADEAKIRSYGVLAKRLSSLESENEDNFLEHGIQTFGFGYPLLIKRSKKDPTKIIKAPMLIWNLDIERSHNQRNQWTIKRTEDSPVYLNEVLVSHLSSDEGVTLNEVDDELLDDNLIDNDELGTIVDSILEQLGADDFDDVTFRLQKANDRDTIENLTTNKPWIMWSGIFGLYRTQKQSIIRDTEKILEEFDNFDFSQLTIEHFLETKNSCVEVDPSQTEILNTLESDEYKVIQGPPGTGKSQSLTAIISNVLENHGKILVVCEKRTALEVIYNNLEKAGLQNLVAFIEDVNRDRKRIIDTVREVCKTVRYEYQDFNETAYDQKLQELAKLKKEYDERNSNLNGLAFGGMKFRDLIAKYLKLKRSAENDLFSEVTFQFTDDEFNELDGAIQDAGDLYRAVDEKAFVFDLLQSNVFSEHYSNSLKNGIFQKLQAEHDFLRSFDFTKITIGQSNLKTDTLSPEMLKEFDFEAFRTIHQLAKSNLDFWKGLVHQLSVAESFITSSSIMGSNPVHRDIYSLNNLLADITRMRRYFESVNNCLNELGRAIDAIPDSRRQPPLHYHWSVAIRKYFGRSNKSIGGFWVCLNSQIQAINDLSDHQFFNSKKNLANFLSAKETTSVDADFICNQIQKCIDEKANFREYFQWRRYKESLSELPKACVSILASSVEPAKWIATFQYAYYARLIEKLEIDIQHFNENDSKLKRIVELEEQVRDLQHHKILKAFDLKQYYAINEYNKRGNINWLFNYKKKY